MCGVMIVWLHRDTGILINFISWPGFTAADSKQSRNDKEWTKNPIC